MSNRKRARKPEPPPSVAALAAAARCSDCNGRAVVRYRREGWDLTLMHGPGCPGRAGVTQTLHDDAVKATAAAAASSGADLAYRPLGELAGVVTGSAGIVTG